MTWLSTYCVWLGDVMVSAVARDQEIVDATLGLPAPGSLAAVG